MWMPRKCRQQPPTNIPSWSFDDFFFFLDVFDSSAFDHFFLQQFVVCIRRMCAAAAYTSIVYIMRLATVLSKAYNL